MNDADWWKSLAQQMALRIYAAEKELNSIALNHAEAARSGVTRALGALNGDFTGCQGYVPEADVREIAERMEKR